MVVKIRLYYKFYYVIIKYVFSEYVEIIEFLSRLVDKDVHLTHYRLIYLLILEYRFLDIPSHC